MSEQTPQPGIHQEIEDMTRKALSELPSRAASTEYPTEDLSIVRVAGNDGYVRMVQDENGPNVMSGRATSEKSTQPDRPGGIPGVIHGFSSTQGEGVTAAVAMKRIDPKDRITRAQGTAPEAHIYEHRFSPENRGRAAKLMTSLAIKQAKRGAGTPPETRKAA